MIFISLSLVSPTNKVEDYEDEAFMEQRNLQGKASWINRRTSSMKESFEEEIEFYESNLTYDSEPSGV